MSDEITATKNELYKDIKSLIDQNGILIKRVSELQSQVELMHKSVLNSDREAESNRRRSKSLKAENRKLHKENKALKTENAEFVRYEDVEIYERKIKADAIRDAVEASPSTVSYCGDYQVQTDDLLEYADKIERGEE